MTIKTGLDAVADAADAVSKPDHEKAVAAASTQAKAEGEKSGATIAQARIKSILTAKDAKGREELANHLAFNTAMSAEDAVATLAAAPKPQAAAPVSRLDTLMPGETPKVAESAGKDSDASVGLAAALDRQLGRMGKERVKFH
jgi:hypothetical protein